MVSRLGAQPPASQTPGGGAEAPTLPTMSKLKTVEPEEDVRSRMDTLIITDVAAKTAPTVSGLKEKSESGTGTSGGEKTSKKSTASGETRAPTQFLSAVTTSSTQRSMERAYEELKVEHIQRTSPVRKLGTSGDSASFMTNYIKLKCRNPGVYQYVVHYDPPLDSQKERMRMIRLNKESLGEVRLFDGHTLFLPRLLSENFSSYI
jgi:hypothetical protein